MKAIKYFKNEILQSGLMKNTIRILTCVCMVIVIAFLSNYVIIHRWYQEELIQAQNDFFTQITASMEEIETDIIKIADSIKSNSVVVDYIYADVLGGRWKKMSEIGEFAANLMELDSDIVAVSVYNKENELIAMEGTKYAPVPEFAEEEYLAYFSERIEIEGECYFQVIIPIYERLELGGFSKVGHVTLLFTASRLEELVNLAASAYLQDSGYAAVLDRNGGALAEAGNPAVWDACRENGDQGNEYLIFQNSMQRADWQAVYVIETNSLTAHLNQVQMINVLTYIVIIFALIYLCYMMYHKVLKPMKRQLAFVVNYTEDTGQRMEVWDESEFGELEKELNEMLDRIEALNRKVIEEQKSRLQMEYAKKQTEILAYKNQINPHFMHNTLGCIRDMALYRGEKEIARITEAMSRMFQYNVRGGEIVTVREMIRSIRDYAVLIEYRFMGKITVKVSEEEAALDCRLPKMLVHPLLENAVQHGLEPKVDKGTVTLTVSEGEGRLRIEIRDDGIGMDEETLERQRKKFTAARDLELHAEGGIGVANVARRLELFYGKEYGIRMESTEGAGTVVSLILPECPPDASADIREAQA